MNLILLLWAVPTDEKPIYPTAKGTKWIYRADGTEKTWTLGEEETMPVRGLDVGLGRGRKILGWGREAYVVETKDRIRIYELRSVGEGGIRRLVVVWEFRWDRERWRYDSIDGRIAETIQGRRLEREKIEVPAGKFECTKFLLNGDTYWISRGVGIVKWTAGQKTWELDKR